MTDSLDQFERDLFFTLLKWLEAKAPTSFHLIKQQLQSQLAFGHSINWKGDIIPLTYNDLTRNFPEVDSEHFLRAIKSFVSLQNEREPFSAKSSLLFPPLPPSKSSWSVTSVRCSDSLWPFLTSVFQFHRLRKLKTIHGHLVAIYCTVIDSSGAFLLTGSEDRLIKMWSTRNGALICTFKGHNGEITDLAISPDDQFCASSSSDCSIRLWGLKGFSRGKQIRLLSKHEKVVNNIKFAPRWGRNNKFLLSCSDDGYCIVWNLENMFAPKKILSFVRYPIHLYRLGIHNETPPPDFESHPKRRTKTVVFTCSWGATEETFFCGGNGGFLFVLSFERLFSAPPARAVAPSKLRQQLLGHRGAITCLIFNRRQAAAWLFSASHDGSVRVWRQSDGSPDFVNLFVFSFKTIFEPSFSRASRATVKADQISLSCDGALLAVSGSENVIQIWDTSEGRLKHCLNGHDEAQNVWVIRMHPTEPRVLFSAGHDGNVVVWDLRSGKVLRKFSVRRFEEDLVLDGCFDGRGGLFACASNYGRVALFGFGSRDPFLSVPREQFFSDDYCFAEDSFSSRCSRVLVDSNGREYEEQPPYTVRERDKKCSDESEEFRSDWFPVKDRRVENFVPHYLLADDIFIEEPQPVEVNSEEFDADFEPSSDSSVEEEIVFPRRKRRLETSTQSESEEIIQETKQTRSGRKIKKPKLQYDPAAVRRQRREGHRQGRSVAETESAERNENSSSGRSESEFSSNDTNFEEKASSDENVSGTKRRSQTKDFDESPYLFKRDRNKLGSSFDVELLEDFGRSRDIYVPQVGDHVVYLRKEHEQWFETHSEAFCGDKRLNPPWKLFSLESYTECVVLEMEMENEKSSFGAMLKLETIESSPNIFQIEVVSDNNYLILEKDYRASVSHKWREDEKIQLRDERNHIEGKVIRRESQTVVKATVERPAGMAFADLERFSTCNEPKAENRYSFRRPSAAGVFSQGAASETLSLFVWRIRPLNKILFSPFSVKNQKEIKNFFEKVVFEAPFSEIFLDGVDPKEYPDYFETVAYPIFLNKVVQKIPFYRSFQSIFWEIQMIVKNSIVFNDLDSEVTKDSFALENFIFEHFVNFLGKTNMESREAIKQLARSKCLIYHKNEKKIADFLILFLAENKNIFSSESIFEQIKKRVLNREYFNLNSFLFDLITAKNHSLKMGKDVSSLDSLEEKIDFLIEKFILSRVQPKNDLIGKRMKGRVLRSKYKDMFCQK